MKTEIYLDSNATTPVLAAARDALWRTLTEDYGNPSSSHSAGLRARAIMDDARARACRLLGVGEGRLMFNSGATEGIQTAVLSALCAVRERRARNLPGGSLLVYGATEHKAVPESLAHWNRVLGLDLELRELAVDSHGRHRLMQLRELAPDAALVCTMAANNETGAVSDLAGIAAALGGSDTLWLVDCVQALGKLPLDLASTRIDYAPFSGHKLYAPKGIGMLYVRAGAPFTPLMAGGGQEDGLRAGTENLIGIAALGAVLERLESGEEFASPDRLAALCRQLADGLRAAFPDVVFNTPRENALPTTLNIAVPGLSSGQLLDVLDAAGVRVSAGSACSAAAAKPSYVLEAMGLADWQCSNAVRISFGPGTDSATMDEACRRIRRCGDALREAALGSGTSAATTVQEPAGAALAADRQAPRSSGRAPGNGSLDTLAMGIDLPALRQLLQEHPETRLVDVRDSVEHAVSPRPGLMQRAANVPLAAFPAAMPQWLAEADRPIVFVCRSGNRSDRAALLLRSRGHRHAFHLAGGLALAEAGLIAHE